jgi:nucleoside-diphosphate-sugar epimerase
MKRIILTGATGFVGANLARKLLKEDHEVHILVRPGYFPWRIQTIRDNLYIHEVEFLDKPKLEAVVNKIRPDWVFHLAAYGTYSWQTDLTQMIQTNILGTINLVEACLQTGFDTFINTGSSSEYGFKAGAPTEAEWLEPNSHYAVTKASATLFCRYTAQSRSVRLFTLRLYSAFGPYEDPKHLMPTLIRYGLMGKLPPLVNPDTARDYVYIDDVIAAYMLAAAKPKQESGVVYNIGSGIQTSLREVVQVARQVFGITLEPEWGTMPQRLWDTNSWVANSQKAQNELGWSPRFTFEQGFRKMVELVSDQNANSIT